MSALTANDVKMLQMLAGRRAPMVVNRAGIRSLDRLTALGYCTRRPWSMLVAGWRALAAEEEKEAGNLARLVERIDRDLASLPDGGDHSYADREKWEARQAAVRAIVDGLVSDEGARYRAGVADGYVLNLAGIRTSCTGGEHGLLTGWCRRARQRIAEIKAAAS